MPAPPALVALDVALMLPPAVDAVMTRLNARLAPPPEGFRFDPTHLPHVTLAQLFGPRVELATIADRLRGVVTGRSALRLTTGAIGAGGTTTVLAIRETPELDLLHRDVMDQLAPFDVAAGDVSAFDAEGDGPARARDVTWVTRFRTEAAYDAFAPHVTLGLGRLNAPAPDLTFDGTVVALCGLGRGCTCRRVLASWTLASPTVPAPMPKEPS